jgi:hypothetical protein
MTLARPDLVSDVGTEMGTEGTAREGRAVVNLTSTSAGMADEVPASGRACCSRSICETIAVGR